MEYFRGAKFEKEITANDAVEIFVGCLKGSTDVKLHLFEELICDYDVTFSEDEVTEFIKFLIKRID